MKQFPPDGLEIGRREALWLTLVGDLVAPEVIADLADGYVMEELQAFPEAERWRLPGVAIAKLQLDVWTNRDPALRQTGIFRFPNWVGRAEAVFGVRVPVLVQEKAELHRGASHGDPSFSNIMVSPVDLGTRLIDPCHRDYTPQTPSLDLGKILQSCLGWEILQADWDPPDYLLPEDAGLQIVDSLRVALWWTGFHALRIKRRELSSGTTRPEVLEWASHISQECFRAVDL